MILVLFAVFLLTLILGFPIAMALGLASFAYVLAADIPLMIIPQRMYSGMDVYVDLCIPGFILAGNLMNESGITNRIINFCNGLVGHIRGGLGLTNVGACMVFAGISGTAVAEAASLGSVMIPAMKKEGYDTDFACALTVSASTVGPIIPPSLPMIIVGTLTGLSVGKLFMAGAIPGVILGLSLMLMSYVISVKRGYPKQKRCSLGETLVRFFRGIWAVLMPLIILVGIVGGICTPTEASIIAVLYALFVGFVIHRELTVAKTLKIILQSAVTTGALIILVGFANLFAWILVSEQIPQAVANLMLSITQNKYIILLLVNLLLLFVGCFMETIAALLILFPVLLKVAVDVGVDPIQFGLICVLNLIIGLTTPPVGVCLFVMSSIGKIPMGQIVKAGWPFLVVSLTVLMLVTYIPQLSLFLPNILFKN